MTACSGLSANLHQKDHLAFPRSFLETKPSCSVKTYRSCFPEENCHAEDLFTGTFILEARNLSFIILCLAF